MKNALPLCLFFVCLQSAHAQLGMPEEKCTALLGKPLRASGPDASGGKTVIYRTPVFHVTVAFKQDTAAYFVYQKNDSSGMSDEEIQSVLDTHPVDKHQWVKKVITGERNPVVHKAKKLKGPFDDTHHGPRDWHIPLHDEYRASYYGEKNVLLIWNENTGFDAATILQQNRL